MVKASDLKSLFGKITNHRPLYLHSSAIRNRRVPGIKSDKLKYPKHICSRCNNELTQPYDRAWEQLSQHLRSTHYNKSQTIRLNKVFPGKVRQSMLLVHLYFVKIFGCLISEHKIPLDIKAFSDSILQGVPHPKIYIAFWTARGRPDHRVAGRTAVHTSNREGKITFATWSYIVDNISVNVMYAEPSEHRLGMSHAWQPSKVGKRVHIKCDCIVE